MTACVAAEQGYILSILRMVRSVYFPGRGKSMNATRGDCLYDIMT